ncbi:hypothetical protein OW763_10530 [Clostridium aestuarii]|uniref:Uncharacterized protein n=1 Tax=Clostridium aestuarii TaxID=338193 RepID=A0ABT4D3C5_9CLOT|nr:hypothetical protein [Clostridium aestuarii]MCY6484775.1 hypothetical protein [Clostridium aestuarii]
MLKLSLLEFFLRGIPEQFIFICANYVFSNKTIDKKALCISTILLTISSYLIRFLPIHYGVHTILFIITYVLLCVFISKIDIIKAISSALISVIILLICEGINVFVLEKLFKIQIDMVFKEPLSKILYSTPSLLLFGITVFIFHRKFYKKRAYTNVFN